MLHLNNFTINLFSVFQGILSTSNSFRILFPACSVRKCFHFFYNWLLVNFIRLPAKRQFLTKAAYDFNDPGHMLSTATRNSQLQHPQRLGAKSRKVENKKDRNNYCCIDWQRDTILLYHYWVN